MRFKATKVQDVPWREGAVLKIKQPDVLKAIAENPAIMENSNDGSAVALMLLPFSLAGWTGIEDDETGQDLPFNAATKSQVLLEVVMSGDKDLATRLAVALKGALGNLGTGSIAS